jgi:hypothetical protein
MRRRFGLLFLTALGTVTLMGFHSPLVAQGDQGKRLVCHHSGKSGKSHVISVAASAVPAHLKHGDCLLSSTDSTLVGQACDSTNASETDTCAVQP